MTADRQSWKSLPAPSEREKFEVSWTFPAAMGDRMVAGHIPEGMDDRWFILMEKGWLLFHRSWTGACIFGLKVDTLPKGATIKEGWVSRNADEYSSTDLDGDVELVHRLVGEYFLMPPREPHSPFMVSD